MFKIPEEIIEILDRFKKAGYEGYIVGGATRDLLLKQNPTDYDLTTDAPPEIIEKLFLGYPKVNIGKKFGTILLIYKGWKVEITTYRTEKGYKDGRRPDKVKYSKRLDEDLKRRDFTINAIAYNPSEGVIDLFNGIKDLENKLIRTVGDPFHRFKEDYLRILRAIRFASQLNFVIEDETYKACKKYSKKINSISKERIRDEIFKIIMSDNSSYGIELLREAGLLKEILPELEESYGFHQYSPYHDKDVYYHTLEVINNSPKKLEIRLAALFHDLGKVHTFTVDDEGIGHFYGHDKVGVEIAKKVLKRWNCSKELIYKVTNLVDSHMINNKQFKTKGIKRLINKLGEKEVFDLMELQKADRSGLKKEHYNISDILNMENQIKEILNSEEVYNHKELAIDGNDVIELGYEEGKIIGIILNYAFDLVLENPKINEKEILLKKIKERF